jgi:hypothetical protein
MHAYITTDGQYCSSLSNPLVNSASRFDAANPVLSMKSSQEWLKLYPNPTATSFTIELLQTPSSGNTRVDICNMSGSRVLSEEMNGETQHVFGVSGLPAGIYFIHIVNDNFSETRKLIKQ